MSAVVIIDLLYLGAKTCFYVTKFVGIAGYNTIAHFNGYEKLEYFPKSKEQLLLEEVKELKNELKEIRLSFQNRDHGFNEVIIEEILPNNETRLLTNGTVK